MKYVLYPLFWQKNVTLGTEQNKIRFRSMKHFSVFLIFCSLGFWSCSSNSSDDADDVYTGREMVYDLFQTSDFPVSGSVIFKERNDSSVEVNVNLNGTEGNVFHPVHLHYGDVTTPDAEIAFLLNDLKGEEGISSTIVRTLSDESQFTFDKLQEFDGSVKVHLGATGADADIVLAGGNIGLNQSAPSTGRLKVPVCKSE